MLAIMNKCSQSTKYLVDSGSFLDLTNEYGESALSLAVFYGDATIAQLLIARGANLKEPPRKSYPMASFALSWPQFWGTPELNAILAADGGYTTEFQCRKILGHRFALKGTTTLNGKRIDLEGWQRSFAKDLLVRSTAEFYESLRYNPALWHTVLDMLPPNTLEAVLQLTGEQINAVFVDVADAILHSMPATASDLKQRLESGKLTGLLTVGICI